MKINYTDYEPGDVIRMIREWTGLTQKEFGESIGKKERTIQDYEAGRIRYNTDVLTAIAKKHGIKIIIEKK